MLTMLSGYIDYVEGRNIAPAKRSLKCTCTFLFHPTEESVICGLRTVTAEKHMNMYNETDNAHSLTKNLTSFITCWIPRMLIYAGAFEVLYLRK